MTNKVLEVLGARQLEEAVVAPSSVAPSPAQVALVAVAAMGLVGRGELAQVGAAAACSAAMRAGTSMERGLQWWHCVLPGACWGLRGGPRSWRWTEEGRRPATTATTRQLVKSRSPLVQEELRQRVTVVGQTCGCKRVPVSRQCQE